MLKKATRYISHNAYALKLFAYEMLWHVIGYPHSGQTGQQQYTVSHSPPGPRSPCSSGSCAQRPANKGRGKIDGCSGPNSEVLRRKALLCYRGATPMTVGPDIHPAIPVVASQSIGAPRHLLPP
jgi:hypothetical protein